MTQQELEKSSDVLLTFQVKATYKQPTSKPLKLPIKEIAIFCWPLPGHYAGNYLLESLLKYLSGPLMLMSLLNYSINGHLKFYTFSILLGKYSNSFNYICHFMTSQY